MRRALTLVGVSVLLYVGVAALGDSAAVAGLGPATVGPPWDVAALLGRTARDGGAALAPSWLVTLLLVAATVTGAAGVLLGVRAGLSGGGERAGAVAAPRRTALAGLAVALLCTLVPPLGSADHLSYVAYGRIAAAGDDPYLVAPIAWRGGQDPVAGAVQPPWQRTPDVYGPVATAAFTAASWLGGGSLRRTVWAWQLLCTAAFLAVGLLLARAAGADPTRRACAALLWTLNPLLLAQLVLGAHVDVLAAAFAAGALVAGVRRPLLAGALVGAAAAVKPPYALAGVALLHGLAALPAPPAAPGSGRVGSTVARRALVAARGVAGAVAVVLPAYLLAGPHVLDQLGQASGFTSIASPWRAVVNLVELASGPGSLRRVVVPVALLLTVLLALTLQRRLRALLPDDAAAGVLTGALAWTFAWVLLAPYALPWYDALLWAPLALTAATFASRATVASRATAPILRLLVTVATLRLAALAVAYLPGRVVGLQPWVETLTLGARRFLAPVLMLAAIVVVVWFALGRPRGRVERPAERPGEHPAG